MKTSASALLVGATVVAATAQQAPQDLLTALHHLARPVLIFAGAGDVRATEQYAALLKHADASHDRQVHVILVTASPIAHVEGGEDPATSVATPAEQEALRKRFHVKPDAFSVILVGKDGGEKMRSDKPIPWETLASTIDAMPMRQTEIRAKAR
ncbi:DUF4174 domain-containing protein [Terriglobus roseus]|uniref:DUF4174 domain-containing protein n=1 Tax=Terriglobus roseus TaxID=392734 RepID=A0A1H4RBY2_9BACT|nr:DUF4174 domain-containing protein [Terriglobus roseus]SEC29385.1 protein of unknown function [Terriglobus roseus]